MTASTDEPTMAVVKLLITAADAELRRDPPNLDRAADVLQQALDRIDRLRARARRATPPAGKTPDSDRRG
jgi:hypothetical protein